LRLGRDLEMDPGFRGDDTVSGLGPEHNAPHGPKRGAPAPNQSISNCT
jgi:hypothetical protein